MVCAGCTRADSVLGMKLGCVSGAAHLIWDGVAGGGLSIRAGPGLGTEPIPEPIAV